MSKSVGFVEGLQEIAKSKLGKGLAGGAVVGGALPYVLMRRSEDEDEEVFNARRRGIAAASGIIGAAAGAHIVPSMLLTKMSSAPAEPVRREGFAEKIPFLGNYLREQRQAEEREHRQAQKEMYDHMTPEERKRYEAEQQAEAQQRLERRKKGFVQRPVLGRAADVAAGTALIAKNVPQIPFATGSTTLYHGTGRPGVLGILAHEGGGLDVRYAGTQGRLNSVLVPNAVDKLLRERLSDKIPQGDFDVFRNMLLGEIRSGGETSNGTFKPVLDRVQDALDRFAKLERYKDNPAVREAVTAVKQDVKGALHNAGVRTYFANSPHNVMTWADSQNELEKITKAGTEKLMEGSDGPPKGFVGNVVKGVANDVADFVSGGAVDVGRQMGNAAKYQNELKFHPEKMSPAQISEMVRDLPDTARYAFGVHVPTHDAKMLADFKGIGPILRMSPRLQGLMSKIPGFEGYDPNNDISVSHNIPRNNIKFVDIVKNEGEAPTRYFLNSFAPDSLTFGQRAKALGRAAVPIGLTALGANLIYRGVSGRKGAVQTGIEAARAKYLPQNTEQSEQVKAAAAAPTAGQIKKFRPMWETTKDVLKYGVPIVGAGMAVNAIDAGVGDAIMPVKDYEIEPKNADDEAKGLIRDTGRRLSGSLLRGGIALGAAGVGAAYGKRKGVAALQQMMPDLEQAVKSNPNNKGLKEVRDVLMRGAGRVGAWGGTQLPLVLGVGSAAAARAYNNARVGEDSMREQLGETRQEIAASPWKSAVVPTLATLGGAHYVGTATRKNFPGMLASLRSKALYEGLPVAGVKLPPIGLLVPESFTKGLEHLAQQGEGYKPSLAELRAAHLAAEGHAAEASMKANQGAAFLGSLKGMNLLKGGLTQDTKLMHHEFEKARQAAEDARPHIEELFAPFKGRQAEAGKKILQNAGVEAIPLSYQHSNESTALGGHTGAGLRALFADKEHAPALRAHLAYTDSHYANQLELGPGPGAPVYVRAGELPEGLDRTLREGLSKLKTDKERHEFLNQHGFYNHEQLRAGLNNVRAQGHMTLQEYQRYVNHLAEDAERSAGRRVKTLEKQREADRARHRQTIDISNRLEPGYRAGAERGDEYSRQELARLLAENAEAEQRLANLDAEFAGHIAKVREHPEKLREMGGLKKREPGSRAV